MQQQSFNQQSQQQGIMPEPPSMISTKDLSYINDMLSWNLIAMKKAHFAAEHCQDQDVRNALEKCGQMHQRHFEKIMSHLDAHMQNQTSQQTTTM